MTIETSRLTLRLCVESDADALFEVFRRPEVARWSGNGEPMTHRDQAVQRIERQADRAGAHPAAGVFAIVPHGRDELVGIAMLVPLPPSEGSDVHVHEIGWHLHPDVWGRGYATEAARALVQRAWDAGLDQLRAVTNPDNIASQAVCARLGMIDLGLRSEAYDRELRTFSLHRPEGVGP